MLLLDVASPAVVVTIHTYRLMAELELMRKSSSRAPSTTASLPGDNSRLNKHIRSPLSVYEIPFKLISNHICYLVAPVRPFFLHFSGMWRQKLILGDVSFVLCCIYSDRVRFLSDAPDTSKFTSVYILSRPYRAQFIQPKYRPVATLFKPHSPNSS